MRILYTVHSADPAEHRGRFSIDLEGLSGPSLDLVLPSWVPGSYHIVNYVRGFRGLSARREPERTPIPVERIDKARWRLTLEGASSAHVDYTVYGHELVDEAFDLTTDHLFLNAALCLPYVDGHLTEPVELRLDVPSDWKVVSELEPVGADPRHLRAAGYDDLADNPVDAGHPTVVTIRPAGIPHRISLCGDGGNYEMHRLETDLGKIVEATVRLIGDSPLTSYTFFYHLNDVSDGGLEHARSTSCVVPRLCFAPSEDYDRFLTLSSHEYFHLYNVKRIRPRVLGPFDYTREVYTRQLWWMEGTTEYFSGLVLLRAGLFPPPKFLDAVAGIVRKFLLTPGRHHQSLEESSLLAWVDHYQPFEETVNQSISYYDKGALVSMCLDLEIRSRTECAASLETVLRTLWTEYGKIDRGLAEDELPSVVTRATGLDLAPFFAKYVRGTDEIDFNAFLGLAGLSIGPKAKEPGPNDDTSGYLGLRFQDSGGLPRVREVLADTPARRAGLTPGDELVAINRSRVTYDKFERMLKHFPPGTPVEISYFRRGQLRTAGLEMGTPPPEKYAVTPVAEADERARRVYESWIGAKWEPAPASPGK